MCIRVDRFSEKCSVSTLRFRIDELGPHRSKSSISTNFYYIKKSAVNFQSLCIDCMYYRGYDFRGISNLFSKKSRMLLKDSMIPMWNPILRRVIEVTFFARMTGNGRFGPFSFSNVIT